ncbi:hypothetical protein WA171_004486 [Blastocystis sp. BT1]
MSGNIEIKQEEIYESTLDESVVDTLMRDAKVIFGKLRIVVFGNVANPEIQKHIDDWDVWGPLLIGVVNAFIIALLSNYRPESNFGGSTLFSVVIIVQWVGGFLLAVHSKLIGLNISFLQMISALGYSLVPSTIFNILYVYFFRRLSFCWVIALASLAWSLRTFNVFMSKSVDNRRRIIALVPAGLYFCFFLLDGLST